MLREEWRVTQRDMWTYSGPSEVDLTHVQQDSAGEPNIKMNVQDKIVVVTGG